MIGARYHMATDVPNPMKQDKVARACRLLWLKVIHDAVHEYRYRGDGCARMFLFSNGRYFNLVCELAGVDPGAVQAAAEEGPFRRK